jgi:hypothetical protein
MVYNKHCALKCMILLNTKHPKKGEKERKKERKKKRERYKKERKKSNNNNKMLHNSKLSLYKGNILQQHCVHSKNVRNVHLQLIGMANLT